MLASPQRLNLITSLCVVLSAASIAAFWASHRWMISYHVGHRCWSLHEGAINWIDSPSNPNMVSPWSGNAWKVSRDDTDSTIWWFESFRFTNAESTWAPMWPLIALSLAGTTLSIVKRTTLHWTLCRGCGYRRSGITYDLPCPECGTQPRLKYR
jgi:hypothetical protein